MHKTLCILIVCFGCLLSGSVVRAETFHLTDGKTITGDLVTADGDGLVLKQADGTYGDKTPWTKLSQADLKELQQNPKYAQFVEPFIEPSPDEKLKRTEINVKEVEHLSRPPKGSFIAAMFTSGLGIFTILILYAGNIYAGYEISIFRGQSAGMVCGVSAVAPVIGPIIFLCIPKKLPQHQEQQGWGPPPEEQAAEAGVAAVAAADQAAADQAATAPGAAPQPAAKLPPTKTFARGQFTFNRRFFETQLTPFFAMTRPDAEKDNVLTFKTARGNYEVARISRVSATEITLHIQKGPASEDVNIPFVEVQEVTVKHKDA